MQCPECGEAVSRRGAYCGRCGAVLPRRKRWPFVVVGVVVVALVLFIAAPLLREQAAANRDDHRVTFVMKTPGYKNDSTPIPVHVVGTGTDGYEYDKMVYLDSGGNGVVLTPGDYTLTFPGGSILANGTVLTAPADFELKVTVPEGLARNEFVQLPADQTVAYTAIAPLDLTEETLTAVYTAAARNPEDHGKAAELRDNAWQKHEDAVAQKEADTAAIEKKATSALDVSVGDTVQFIGTLQICTAEEAGERLEDDNIQWNLYGRTLAILWLDEPREVTLEDLSSYNYYGYSSDDSDAYKIDYEVSCLVLSTDVEGLYTYNGADDGTLAAQDGKHVLVTGKIASAPDWASSQISPLTVTNPTFESI